jgi:hypothetical protein
MAIPAILWNILGRRRVIRMLRTRLFLTCFVLLFALISGYAASDKHPSVKLLEKIDDPPMFIFRLGISPRTISRFGAFISYQVNVDASGNNITGDAANEPSLSVDPTNHNRMVIGWRQFDSVASNFRQAGWAYTSDGGTSWAFPGVLENDIFRSDPVLNTDSGGNFFYLSLLGTFFDNVWRSLSGGQSWTNIAPAQGGDKEWFTIDKTNSTGRGFQYQSWSSDPEGNNFNGRQFTRSIDGGVTWSDPINIPNSPSFGTLDVDSNGNLFIGGLNFDTNQIWCVRSTNAKDAAVVPSFDQSTAVNLGGNIVGGAAINPVGLVGQLNVVVDHSGTATNNYVYMLASVQPFGFTIGSEVMFVRSTDGGSTFSAPRRVSDDPVDHNKWHWLGALSVAPNGRLDAVWLDTRAAANNTDSQLFYSYSTNAGDTWSANVAVSAPFNPFLGYPNQNKIGDYITIVSDTTGGDVAYSATFNGEQDIYYLRVAPLTTQLLNISTRLRVDILNNVLIGGFIITGNAPKNVALRGIGPSLGSSGIPDVLGDPTLVLHDSAGALILANDDWETDPAQAAQLTALGLALQDPKESGIVVNLQPGSYTAVLAGKNQTTGVGLVEIYDTNQATGSQLANISTRGLVLAGNNVMIGGLVLGGASNTHVVVRGIGPSLARYGLTPVLADPLLELHDSNGVLLISNDNWQDDLFSAAQLEALGLAPEDPVESGIYASLPPGAFTGILAGKNGGTGIGLVEIYNVR